MDEVPGEAGQTAGHCAGVWHTARRSASATARTYISACASPQGSLIGCSRTPRDVPASATETRTHWNGRYRRVCLSRCRPGRRLPVRSEEHTSELQSLMRTPYALFCLKKKKQNNMNKKRTYA